MQFGMPTLIEHGNIREAASLCRELGLTFIELNMNLPDVLYAVVSGDDRETDNLLELCAQYGVYFTIHLEESFNVCDFNSAVAQAYGDTLEKTIRTAKVLNTPLLNMHLNRGVHFTLPDKKAYLFERYQTHYAACIRNLRELCEDAIDGADITVCIENTNGFASFEQEALKYLLQSEVFALTWDIGHSHTAANVDEAFLLEHENKLRHFHIHDAFGEKNHLPLAIGEVDIPARLAIAQRNSCRCVIETKTEQALRQSVKWLREYALV